MEFAKIQSDVALNTVMLVLNIKFKLDSNNAGINIDNNCLSG